MSDVQAASPNRVSVAPELVALLKGRDVPCESCAYNLRDLVESKCPECGAEIDFARTKARIEAAQTRVVARRLGPVALFAAFAPPLGTVALFATASITVPWLREQEGHGVWIYAAAFAICAGLALLPTYAQSGLAGYTFGLVDGSAASIAGFIGASLIGYAIARRVSGERVIQLAEENPKFAAIRRAFVGEDFASGGGDAGPRPHHFWRTLGLVILLRLPPNSPFALMNLAMASLRVPRLPFAIGTAIGMAPRTILAAAIGSWVAGPRGDAAAGPEALSSEALKAAAPSWVMPVGIGVTVIVLVILGVLANRVVARVAGRPPISGQ